MELLRNGAPFAYRVDETRLLPELMFPTANPSTVRLNCVIESWQASKDGCGADRKLIL